MSAFMVHDSHIDAMLTAGLANTEVHGPVCWVTPSGNRTCILNRETATQIGRMLQAENSASVAHRYSHEPDSISYCFKPWTRTPDPVMVLKAIACYEYQSCEHEGWVDSEARRFCEVLRAKTIGELPGWDEAPWSIDESHRIHVEIGGEL